MNAPELLVINEQHFWLSPDKVMFWEEQEALIACDLHFGKTGHFRKAGIAVPENLYKDDLHCLFSNLTHFKAKQLIVVGDMFHSVNNKELSLFEKWRNDLPYVTIHLVKGNHDILPDNIYQQYNILIHASELIIGNFCFRHDLATNLDADKLTYYTFSGHIHPGIRISGAGKQTITVPCFYFGEKEAILPAFSKFTGYIPIKTKKGDTVYGILKDKLIKI